MLVAAAGRVTMPSFAAAPDPRASPDGSRIDRRALAKRHNVVLRKPDLMNPLSVGNGEFAFTADITGLQTFNEDHSNGVQLATMAQWGFHTAPNPKGYSLEKFPLTKILTNGRSVGYLYYEEGKSRPELKAPAEYLYANPGRLNLGRIGLLLTRKDGRGARLSDLEDIHQELDLWSGTLLSRFTIEGETVEVRTACHPSNDQLAVAIASPLVGSGRVAVLVAFPYASGEFGGDGADWARPHAHETVMERVGNRRANFHRTLDGDSYNAAVSWTGDGSILQTGQHLYHLSGHPGSDSLEFSAAFAPGAVQSELPTPDSVFNAAAGMWAEFWSSGGTIDLSQSSDGRWRELERRIVLSRYLTRIQSAGSLPPQETGLTCNSWFGKFHLEMHWWHAAHFALWGHPELLERSLPYYQRILPKAKESARAQGYKGARWPKCVGPAGDPAPTYLECFLIWQQPHPISYAELCYRADPRPATLEKYREIVFETAEFMASFAAWDESRGQYRIGPPLADAAEVYFDDHERQWNPTFEVAQWKSGLQTAQKWRDRLGLGPDQSWSHVIAHLPPLTVRDGLYVAGETARGTFADSGRNVSHPCMVAPMGILNGSMVDRRTMRATLDRVLSVWNWKETWGWDYPMLAMTAARLGNGEAAVDVLLMDEVANTYTVNGHNFQSQKILPLYLPGNGGLLYTVAMMAAGWEGAPDKHAPGFPDNGRWIVRHEGLNPAI
jgi:hypothetical protein